MIYKHSQFQLDTDSRKVFDENGKELRLTGNAFRLLSFLCKKRSTTITEIGEYLDHAKEYTENHIRQYCHKINSIIGCNVVEYKNSIYSIIGNIEVLEKNHLKTEFSGENKNSDRITDLLRSDSLLFGIINMKNISKKPAIIASVLLLLTFFPWPYAFYTILRWVVSLVSVYYIIGFYGKQKVFDYKIWTLVVIAVLFNPIAPIYLFDKSIWLVIDVLVAGFLLYFSFK